MGALVQQHSTAGSGTNTKTETFSACVAGNLMLIVAATNENAGTSDINTPSGWTLLKRFRQDPTSTNIGVYGKTAAGGETSQVITCTAAAQRFQTWFGEFSGYMMPASNNTSAGNSSAVSTASPLQQLGTPATSLYLAAIACKNAVTSLTGSYTGATVTNEGGGVSTQKVTVGIRYNVTPPGTAQVSFSWSGITAAYSAIAIVLPVKTGTNYTQGLTAGFTPTGAVTRGPQNHLLQGSITPTGSDPVKATTRPLAGSVGFSGTRVANTARRLTGAISFAGSLPSTGSLSKAVTAAFTPTGSLARLPQKALPAVLAPVGRLLSGAGVLRSVFTPTGTLNKATTKGTAFTASLSFVGSFSRSFAFLKSLTGSLSFTGSLPRRVTTRTLTATFTPTALFTRMINVLQLLLPAGFAPTGDIAKQTSRNLPAGIQPTAALNKNTQRSLTGVFTPVGSVAHNVGKVFFGALRAAGSLSSLYIPGPGPTPEVAFSETVSSLPGGGGLGAVMSDGFFKRYRPSYKSTLRKQKP